LDSHGRSHPTRTKKSRESAAGKRIRTSAVSAAPGQPFLFDVSTITGYSLLKKEQLIYAHGILRGLNQTKAAEAAGYPESTARKRGCELGQNGNVLAFLNQAWLKSGQTADELIARTAERARVAHTAMMTLTPGTMNWKRAQQAAHEEDELLAAIHGRLKINLNVAGEVRHSVSVEVADLWWSNVDSQLARARN
jgi:hypothetical protein